MPIAKFKPKKSTVEKSVKRSSSKDSPSKKSPEEGLNSAVEEVEEEDLGCLLNPARRGQPHLTR